MEAGKGWGQRSVKWYICSFTRSSLQRWGGWTGGREGSGHNEGRDCRFLSWAAKLVVVPWGLCDCRRSWIASDMLSCRCLMGYQHINTLQAQVCLKPTRAMQGAQKSLGTPTWRRIPRENTQHAEEDWGGYLDICKDCRQRYLPSRWKRVARRKEGLGTFLVVQWLRLRASNTGGTSLTRGQGTRIQHALWCSKKVKT